MKVLVTGVAGQLGHDVVELLESREIPCRGVDLADFDLTDGAAVKAWVQDYAPDVIVHCAAYTNVDRAESEPEICAAVNGMGTMNMVRAALSVNAKMVYISTDYVFPGTGEKPWEPEDEYGPQNVYGMSKVQGENAVRSLMTRFFILRTSWVFGLNGRNFVRTMLRLGRERSSVRVVCDQVGSPTYTGDLAPLICQMIQTDRYGVYHATNEGFCSWAAFAKAIFEQAGIRCRVEPIPSSAYPTPARRPMNSRLSKACLTEAGFSPLPPWEDALGRYLRRLSEAGEL